MQITVTAADDRKTVNLRIGDSVRLLLDDPAFHWANVNVSPAGRLAPDPAPSPPPHGALAIWTAVQRGTVTITAVAAAWCEAGVACPMWARLYQVTVVVS